MKNYRTNKIRKILWPKIQTQKLSRLTQVVVDLLWNRNNQRKNHAGSVISYMFPMKKLRKLKVPTQHFALCYAVENIWICMLRVASSKAVRRNSWNQLGHMFMEVGFAVMSMQIKTQILLKWVKWLKMHKLTMRMESP